MVGDIMCLYDGSQWCSVCGEEEGSKNRSLRNPSDQLMCSGFLPSPGHLEGPAIEIGFKPVIPVISSDERVDRRIWRLTMSKAADRSSRMRIDDLESAFAIRKDSVTESSAVSVECPRLNPDWLASSRLWTIYYTILIKYLKVFSPTQNNNNSSNLELFKNLILCQKNR